MIRLEAVAFAYEDMRMEFNLHVAAGAFLAVIGPSGSGKSTLLSLIAGFERAAGGRILLAGRDMTDTPPARRPVSLVFQEHNAFAHLDVWSNIALGRSPALSLTPDASAAVESALARTGLMALRHRLPGELSGGERQRIGIARALVRDHPVLLLDEPFTALGPRLRHEMLDLISALRDERGLTVILVSHDPQDARRAADAVAFTSAGRILAQRPTADFFARRDLPEVRDYLGEE